MTPIIRVDHLRHTYSAGTPFEKVAIDDIDLDIPAGQFVGIIGHTGSGKSTFIQHLNGLLAPTSGTVFFDGEDIHRSKEATRDVRFQVGLVFQYPEHQLFEETVYRDIAFGPKNARLSAEEVDARVREAARTLGIEDVLQKYPYQMSGGQKQRIAAARAMVADPKLVLADEPTGALDSRSATVMLETLSMMNADLHATIMMVTHDSFAASFASRILFIKDGEVFHQLYRGRKTNDELYQNIADTLTMITTGGDRR